ncbi:hypothetical protein LJB84_03180 [Bacteroidales bacterium OttesenSCG-928-J19]|nr:hypothetical protein [Bacteroidales bacterium OttesenSCG-928-J19]
MRLTTKIVFGIIGGVFALSLLFIIGFSFSERRYFRTGHDEITIPQEQKITLETGSFKTLILNESESKTNIHFWLQGELRFLPLTDSLGGMPQLEMPEALSKCLDRRLSGDTLYLTINAQGLGDWENREKSQVSYQGIKGINLTVYTSSVDVRNRISGISTRVEGIDTDEIKVRSASDIALKNCTAITVVPRHQDNKRLTLLDCRIDTLDLDLKETGARIVNRNDIAVEILRGDREHRVYRYLTEAKEVLWIPKSDKAKLEMVFDADTARVVFQ